MSIERQMQFIDPSTNETLLLPVTPEKFELSHGINMETVNIHTVGDTVIAGYGKLPSFKLECIFPANNYPFNNKDTNYSDPYSYVWKLEEWCDKRTVLRFVISRVSSSGTTSQLLDVPVLMEDITYGERDGTNDLYATITIHKYKRLTVTSSEGTSNATRSDTAAAKTPETYTIRPGDTLSAICRKNYGDASLYPKLARFNGIKNPNLIYAGNTLKIPDKSLL